MCNLYYTILCALCRYVQMRFYFYNCKSPYEHLSRANTDIEQLEVQVQWFLVRLPNQVPGLLKSGGEPVVWFLLQDQSLKSGKAQIFNQIKFLHFGKKKCRK